MSKSWFQTYPKLVSKNDLRGKRLKVFADKPPEPSAIKGMSVLVVWEVDTENTYEILVTRKDIQTIIDLVTKNKHFSFNNAQPYAEVIAFEEI